MYRIVKVSIEAIYRDMIQSPSQDIVEKELSVVIFFLPPEDI